MSESIQMCVSGQDSQGPSACTPSITAALSSSGFLWEQNKLGIVSDKVSFSGPDPLPLPGNLMLSKMPPKTVG